MQTALFFFGAAFGTAFAMIAPELTPHLARVVSAPEGFGLVASPPPRPAPLAALRTEVDLGECAVIAARAPRPQHRVVITRRAAPTVVTGDILAAALRR